MKELWKCLKWKGKMFTDGKVYLVQNDKITSNDGSTLPFNGVKLYSKWRRISLEDYVNEALKIQ